MEMLYTEELQLHFSREQKEEEIQQNGDRVWNSRKEILEYLENNQIEGKYIIGQLDLRIPFRKHTYSYMETIAKH